MTASKATRAAAMTRPPACRSAMACIPPGTVVGNYQSQSPGLGDYIPGHHTDLVYQPGTQQYWTYPQSYVSNNPVDTVPDNQ